MTYKQDLSSNRKHGTMGHVKRYLQDAQGLATRLPQVPPISWLVRFWNARLAVQMYKEAEDTLDRIWAVCFGLWLVGISAFCVLYIPETLFYLIFVPPLAYKYLWCKK